MRRTVVITLAAMVCTLSGCAWQTDRYGAARNDPFLWWLSGAPQPYDLNWPRTYPPDLPILNPSEYIAVPPPRPLDVPRGWSPYNPPYLGTGNERTAPEPASTPDAADPRCTARCEAPAQALDGAAARPDVRAGVRDGERARQP